MTIIRNPSPGIKSFHQEREHQLVDMKFDEKHDKEWTESQLENAAMCYIAAAEQIVRVKDSSCIEVPPMWPWDKEWWNPESTPEANIAKAGALLAAAYDRIINSYEKFSVKDSEKSDNDDLCNSVWTHISTAIDYKVIDVGLNESDLSQVVIYTEKFGDNEARPNGPIWVRPLKEFFDGRFIRK